MRGGVVGLQMDREQVGPGLGESLHIAHRLVDHQVHVQKQVGAFADGLHHRHADGEVGYEAAVHHVHVEHVGAGHPGDIPLQIHKISGEDGGRDFNHFFTTPWSVFQKVLLKWAIPPEEGRGTGMRGAT